MTVKSEPEYWTMVIHDAEPCTGFQVMHSTSMPDGQQPVDLTHTAVRLPNVFAKATDGRGHLPASADSKTWLIRAGAAGSLRLWLSGEASTRATIQVHTVHFVQLH